uniref:Uncharacterized protein n=1 Tax=Oryza meridionalis TaxID=40149 RepID=A0A0E0CFG1_9ORYZ
MATTTPAARKIAGTEVPIPGSDRVRWIELTVPSTPSPSPEGDSDPFVLVPPRAASGFHVVSSGDSQCYLAWRFHEEQQNVLEVIDLCAFKEFPSSGLRLVFQEELCPFSFLCAREGGRRGTPVYLLYVLTVSGVALLCHLRSPFSYISGSIFPQDDIVEFNLQTQVQSAKVTAVTAMSGCLVIGRQDGSICCYSFLNELRDDAGIGRLWSLVSRTKAVGPVQDIVTATVNERELLFVLHLDGSLRIWDIFNHTKLLSYNVRSNDIEGQPSRIWVGDADDDQELIFLAVLRQGTVTGACDCVSVYGFSFGAGERFLFSPEPSFFSIPLVEGKLIDLKISMDKLWVLKEVGSMLYEIVQYDCDTEIMHSYVLQEVSVSDQLFQSSENTLDDLVWTADSIFSSKKGQTFSFISSMFLRRLLQPGVNHSSALRETLLEHKRFLSDSYFQSLTTSGLRKEILSTIEQEFTDCKFDCLSLEKVFCTILKILGTGFSPQSPSALITLFGTDAYAERRQTAHKSQRKFSVEMLLSFRKLQSKSTSWSAVFDVIENFMKYLNTNVTIQEYELKRVCNVNTALLVQATSQVARTMFESTFDLYLFLNYLVSIGGQLSSLQLGKADDLSLHRKFGCSYFTLACLLDFPKSADGDVLSPWFPNPTELVNLVRRFSGSIMSENIAGNADCFLSSTINLAAVLVRHGQYQAAQSLLGILDTHMNYVKASQADQDTDLARSSCLHLNGFCLLVLARDEANIVLKESKVHEAIRCFFRAASGQEAPKALQKFSVETGFQISGECRSFTVWRLRYYEWAMQIFEQHSMSEGACEFALGALEQIDSIVDLDNGSEAEDIPETTTMIKGRLWANVFKYKLDLKNFQEAYCAIISNPDNDSKYVCLRRFIIVLCELGETKVICNGEIPFTGLVEKVEQELFWKAERSDLLSRPNLYKVLYSFEAYRNNWRKAAAHMYREGNAGGTRQLSHTLQERLHALSAAINALQLVDPSFAWLDSVCEADDQISPTAFGTDSELSRLKFCVDIEILEKEYTLTEALYMLSTVNSRFNFSDNQSIEALTDILINENMYDMVFTIVLKFRKESGMKRELERVFAAIAQQCCPNRVGNSGKNLLLPSSDDDARDGNGNSIAMAHQSQGSCHWETLEIYLEKYKDLHPRLPVIVAETLLYTDPEIELPLWLVQMFKTTKAGNRMISWGMSGTEADPATLFRLYINYGRHTEAANLLVEYLESFTSSRPVDVLHRKKMSAAWFPYTAIERLWCQLEEMQNAGHSVDQCDRLKKLLHGSLISHLQQVVVDSDDVLSSLGGGKGMGSQSN